LEERRRSSGIEGKEGERSVEMEPKKNPTPKRKKRKRKKRRGEKKPTKKKKHNKKRTQEQVKRETKQKKKHPPTPTQTHTHTQHTRPKITHTQHRPTVYTDHNISLSTQGFILLHIHAEDRRQGRPRKIPYKIEKDGNGKGNGRRVRSKKETGFTSEGKRHVSGKGVKGTKGHAALTSLRPRVDHSVDPENRYRIGVFVREPKRGNEFERPSVITRMPKHHAWAKSKAFRGRGRQAFLISPNQLERLGGPLPGAQGSGGRDQVNLPGDTEEAFQRSPFLGEWRTRTRLLGLPSCGTEGLHSLLG